MAGRVFRNYYKRHMNKTKGEDEREGGGFGWDRGKWWEEIQTTVIEQQ